MFACLPGAGHMYLGFMKMGLSFMIMFFGVCGLAFIADALLYFLVMPIIMVLPVIWFYAFFDCINKNGASDEEFAAYQDHFLFSDVPELQNINWKFNFGFLTSKAPRTAIGFIILISGISMLCRNFLAMINWYYFEELQFVYNILHSILDRLPQLAISVAIIALGIWLIGGALPTLIHFGLGVISPNILLQDSLESDLLDSAPQISESQMGLLREITNRIIEYGDYNGK